MQLSELQQYILKKAVLSGTGVVAREVFLEFYRGRKDGPDRLQQTKSITQSIDRLIQKGLVTGFGYKTADKFFIETIRLTVEGRRYSKKLLGAQTSFPFSREK